METDKYDELLQAVLEVLEDGPSETENSFFWRAPPKTVEDIRHRLRSCLDDIDPDWQGMEVK